MADTGDITAEEADKASQTLPKFPKIEADSQYGGQKGHMLRLVRQELRQMGYSEEEIDGGGLRVTTTFTPEAMQAAEEGVLSQKPEGFGDKELHIAAATVEPGTGALLGFYGGQDYLDSEINWAEAGGMVGSTFKPFTLATAITEGFSLEDTFEGNSPYEFPDGLEVRNEGGGDGNDYGSEVAATYALEESINTAFVDMSASIPDGPEKIEAMANALGIPPAKPDKKYPGIPKVSRDLSSDDALITLGRARISPINMANAYATIANGGVRANVHVIKKVEDRSGEDAKVYDVVNTDALDPDIDSDVSYAMQQVVQEGTGQAALELGRPAAGKTGTATNDKDQVSSAWFVGFTPQSLDGGDVRPRRRRRPARRLAAVLLRRRLPGPHLDGDHAAGHGGHGRRGVPAAGQRRRRGTDRGPRPRAHHGAAADEAADQEAQSHGLADRRADRRAHRRAHQGPDRRPDDGADADHPADADADADTGADAVRDGRADDHGQPDALAAGAEPVADPDAHRGGLLGGHAARSTTADPDPRVKPRSPAEPPTVMG